MEDNISKTTDTKTKEKREVRRTIKEEVEAIIIKEVLEKTTTKTLTRTINMVKLMICIPTITRRLMKLITQEDTMFRTNSPLTSPGSTTASVLSLMFLITLAILTGLPKTRKTY